MAGPVQSASYRPIFAKTVYWSTRSLTPVRLNAAGDGLGGRWRAESGDLVDAPTSRLHYCGRTVNAGAKAPGPDPQPTRYRNEPPMRTGHIRHLLLLGAALGVISCSEDNLPGGCSGNVATETQQGNAINATGSFKGGQPIMRLTQNGANQQYVAGNYDNGTASFDITGVAKGTYTVTWILSCDNGDGEVVMTSTGKNITIT
jgi:hypothetical protein